MAAKAKARRYAQAVFEIARDSNTLDRWQADLDKIVKVSRESPYLRLLEDPKLSVKDRSTLAKQQLEGVSPMAINLVLLLASKDRLSIIGDIADEYGRLVDAYHGIQRAEVITAVPLSDEEQRKLAERLSAVTGKKVVLSTRVDRAVIGGMVARIDGKLLDGSTRTKLLALKQQLAGTT